MPKLRKPLTPHTIRTVQKRSRSNLRQHAAMAVFILTALFLFPGIMAATTSKPDLSTHAIPIWIVLIVITLLMVGADIFAVISLVSKKSERRRNRACALALGLLVISIATAAILDSVLG